MSEETTTTLVQQRRASVEARLNGISSKTRTYLTEIRGDFTGLATDGWSLAEAWVSELRGKTPAAPAELEGAVEAETETEEKPAAVA